MDTVTVQSKSEFADRVMDFCDEQSDGTDVSRAAAEEMWDVWEFRADNGSDDVLVMIPFWLSEEKFSGRRPFFFGKPEYDNDEKAAILWKDVRVVDKNILEAQMWDDVSANEVLTLVDFSDDEDSYVDEKGMTWTPRSQHLIFEYGGNE